jgi:Fe-S-cluster containining protein
VPWHAGASGSAAGDGQTVKACSFLKKRTKKLLFLRRLCSAYPFIEADAEGSKSLLLLFFRKEGLP